MNLRANSLKLVWASTVAVGVVAVATPSYALSFDGKSGGTADIAWEAQIKTGYGDFYDFSNQGGTGNGEFLVTSKTGAFEGLPEADFGVIGDRSSGSIKDTALPVDIGSTLAVDLKKFMTFSGADDSIFSFNLTSILRLAERHFRFNGYFGDNSSDTGYLVLSEQGGLSYSATLYATDLPTTQVPTPALLPGLIGLGLGALRGSGKRTAEASET